MDETISYDVTDWVLSDHFWLRTLLERLHLVSTERAETLPELQRELLRQQRAQESVVLPVADGLLLSFGELKRRFTDGRQRVHELLERLEHIPLHSKEFSDGAAALEHVLGEYVSFIEQEIVLPLRHCLNSDERLELGGRYADARKASDSEPILKLLGTTIRPAGPLVVHLGRA